MQLLKELNESRGCLGEDRMTHEDAMGLQHSIINLAIGIVESKRHDYSSRDDPFGNFRKSELFGVEPWRGVLVRLTDKLSRIESIMEAGGEVKVSDETLLDTFADCVNYICILAGLCYEELDEK